MGSDVRFRRRTKTPRCNQGENDNGIDQPRVNLGARRFQSSVCQTNLNQTDCFQIKAGDLQNKIAFDF